MPNTRLQQPTATLARKWQWGRVVCFEVVAIREAVEDIARLESAVASGKAQPGEVDSLKHAADHAVEDLRCHVDSEALAAAARQEGLILHKVAF